MPPIKAHGQVFITIYRIVILYDVKTLKGLRNSKKVNFKLTSYLNTVVIGGQFQNNSKITK